MLVFLLYLLYIFFLFCCFCPTFLPNLAIDHIILHATMKMSPGIDILLHHKMHTGLFGQVTELAAITPGHALQAGRLLFLQDQHIICHRGPKDARPVPGLLSRAQWFLKIALLRPPDNLDSTISKATGSKSGFLPQDRKLLKFRRLRQAESNPSRF